MTSTEKNRQSAFVPLLLLLALLSTLALALGGTMNHAQPSALDASALKAIITSLVQKRHSRTEIVNLFGSPQDALDAHQIRIKPKFANVNSTQVLDAGADTDFIELGGVSGLKVAELSRILGQPRLSPPLPDGSGRTVVFSIRTSSTECRLVVTIPLRADPEQAPAEGLTIRCDHGLGA